MDFDLKEHTRYLVVAGSHSYGMATEKSDIDIRGWCIPPKKYWLSYHKRFEQHDPTWELNECPWKEAIQAYAGSQQFTIPNLPIDAGVYNISKFMKLAADCNPNIIELLFVDNEDVLVCAPEAVILREARHEFLSSKCKYTFGGYAYAQLKRINAHRRWLLSPPDEHASKPERKQYNDWLKNRNPARAALEKEYGYNCKQGAHLVRLLLQCREIMVEGTLTLKDPKRAAWLTEIRNGGMPYEELVSWAQYQLEQLDTLYEDNEYAVPKKVSAAKLDAMYMNLVEAYLWR